MTNKIIKPITTAVNSTSLLALIKSKFIRDNNIIKIKHKIKQNNNKTEPK